MNRTAMTRPCAAACMLATWLLPVSAQEGGHGEQYAEVRLPSVAIGKTYSTWRLSQAPLIVRNTSDDTVIVHLGVVLPARHDVRQGARAVPDRRWIRVESNDFVLPPHSEERTDVRLSLPYDPDLAGHTYQVDLMHFERRGRGRWAKGERSRLLFRVEMDYRDDTELEFTRRGLPGPAVL